MSCDTLESLFAITGGETGLRRLRQDCDVIKNDIIDLISSDSVSDLCCSRMPVSN